MTVWSMYDYEADDALATGARRWVDDVDEVVVMTPDKDLSQIYDDPRIRGYDRRKGSFIDRDAVVEKFGVEPASIPDWLGLVGDAADALPGLPGWGAKSSATILARYGNLEHIPLDASLWDVKLRGADKLAATLVEHMGEALLYRYLALLRTDVPLPDSLGDLEWKGVPRQRYESLCDELGLRRPERAPPPLGGLRHKTQYTGHLGLATCDLRLVTCDSLLLLRPGKCELSRPLVVEQHQGGGIDLIRLHHAEHLEISGLLFHDTLRLAYFLGTDRGTYLDLVGVGGPGCPVGVAAR